MHHEKMPGCDLCRIDMPKVPLPKSELITCQGWHRDPVDGTIAPCGFVYLNIDHCPLCGTAAPQR